MAKRTVQIDALATRILRTFLPDLRRVCEDIDLVNARLGRTYRQPLKSDITWLLDQVLKSPADIEKLLRDFLSRVSVPDALRVQAYEAPTELTLGDYTFPLLFAAGKSPTILLSPEHLGLLHRIPGNGLRMGNLRPYSDIPVAVSVQVSPELVIGPYTSIRDLTDCLLAHSIRMVAAQDLKEAGLSKSEAIPFALSDRSLEFEIKELVNPISPHLCHYPTGDYNEVGEPNGRAMKLYACWALANASSGLFVRRVFLEWKEAEEALSLAQAKCRELEEIRSKLKQVEIVEGYRLEVVRRLKESQNCLVLREIQVLVFVSPSGARTTVGEWVIQDITEVPLGTDDSSPVSEVLVQGLARILMEVVPVVN